MDVDGEGSMNRRLNGWEEKEEEEEEEEYA